MKNREQLIDKVIEHLREDILAGDVTVLEELLGFIEKDKLVQALPEEEWQEFRSSVDYFNIRATGFNEDIQREEIEINAGENGKIMIYKIDEGFIVDAYGQEGDCLNTMAIWEDDINPLDEEDEPNDFTGEEPICFTPVELREFVNEWGQTHEEICANLNVPDSNDADDILMLDHFWLASENKWYPKAASLYTIRQQEIADHLRHH